MKTRTYLRRTGLGKRTPGWAWPSGGAARTGPRGQTRKLTISREERGSTRNSPHHKIGVDVCSVAHQAGALTSQREGLTGASRGLESPRPGPRGSEARETAPARKFSKGSPVQTPVSSLTSTSKEKVLSQPRAQGWRGRGWAGPLPSTGVWEQQRGLRPGGALHRVVLCRMTAQVLGPLHLPGLLHTPHTTALVGLHADHVAISMAL